MARKSEYTSVRTTLPDDSIDYDEMADSKNPFAHKRYLWWYIHPVPFTAMADILPFRLLEWITSFATPFTIFFTAIVQALAIIVVRMEIASDLSPIGGDGFGYMGLLITFVYAAVLERAASNVLMSVKVAVQEITQHICNVVGLKGSSRSKLEHEKVVVLNAVIDEIRRQSRIPILNPDEIIELDFQKVVRSVEQDLWLKANGVKLNTKFLVERLNLLMAQRPEYSQRYMNAFVVLMCFIAFVVLYPLLLRERMADDWAWLVMSSVISFVTWCYIQALIIAQCELRAWGVE